MSCTARNTVKERLEQDLALIAGACRELNPHIRAIVLYGGYAREEGGWFRDDGGRWCPYNDYDILLVVDRRSLPDDLERTGNAMSRRLGVRWLDIRETSYSELRRAKPTVLNYELRGTGKVVWGDPDALEAIPRFDASRLTLRDAEQLCFTRAWTFLGGLTAEGWSVPYYGDDARFFRNQMAKAWLAVVDALLLSKGTFAGTQGARVQLLHEAFKDERDLLESADWALAEKLHPKAPAMDPEGVRDLYARTRRAFLERMLSVLSSRYGRVLRSTADLERALKASPLPVARRVKACLRARGLQPLRHLRSFLAQMYLVEANDTVSIDPDLLKRGVTHLRSLDRSVPRDADWNTARIAAASTRMEA